jgi:hypothetical protein
MMVMMMLWTHPMHLWSHLGLPRCMNSQVVLVLWVLEVRERFLLQ